MRTETIEYLVETSLTRGDAFRTMYKLIRGQELHESGFVYMLSLIEKKFSTRFETISGGI